MSYSDYSQEQDAITDALSSVDALTSTKVVGFRTTKSYVHSLLYIYEHENNDLVANIATAENIHLTLYYGGDHDWSCPLLDQTIVDITTNDMIAALSTNIGALQYGFFFDKDVMANDFPSKVRSMVQFGAPLDGYEWNDEYSEQSRIYEEVVGKWKDVILPHMGVESILYRSVFGQKHIKNGIEVRYWGGDLQIREFLSIVQVDMFFSIFR